MEGIKFVLGISEKEGPRGGTTSIQSVLLDKNMYTESQAQHWLRRHAFLYGKMDEGKKYWRARQIQPERFKRFVTVNANPLMSYPILDGKRIRGEYERRNYSGQMRAQEESFRESKRLGINSKRRIAEKFDKYWKYMDTIAFADTKIELAKIQFQVAKDEDISERERDRLYNEIYKISRGL